MRKEIAWTGRVYWARPGFYLIQLIMRIRLFVLFVLILVQIEAFAQKPQPFYTASANKSLSKSMIFLNNDNALVKIGKSVEGRYDYYWDEYLFLFDNNGEVIDSMYIHTLTAHYDYNGGYEGSWVSAKSSDMMRYPDGRLSMFLLNFTDSSAQMQRIDIGDDLSLSYTDFDWETSDIYQTAETLEQWVVCTDGGVILAYLVDSMIYSQSGQDYCGIRVLKFDAEGQKVGEYVFNDVPYFHVFSAFYLLPSPDLEGCRLVMRNLAPVPFAYDCYTMDGTLNVVSVNEHIDKLPTQNLCCDAACVKMNPLNGKTYSINRGTSFNLNTGEVVHYQDVLMSMFDAENYNQVAYAWGITSPTPCTIGFANSIDFDGDDGVYMVSGMDKNQAFSESLCIIRLDEDLNKLTEIYYKEDNVELRYFGGICVSSQGDVLIRCQVVKPNMPIFDAIYKVPKEAFDGIEEAHDAGFVMAVAYPNPGKDVLNIRTGLRDAWVEVYDLNGRLMHKQDITESVTGIEVGDWAEGIYVWKVMAEGKEAECGKWVKE